MEDLFYFTKSEVTLDSIAAVAGDAGYRTSITGTGPNAILNIRHPQGYWFCVELPLDYAAFEEEVRRRLDAYGPRSQLMVSFSVKTVPALCSFLKLVLERYGGWVGCDDYMEIVYDASDVEKLHCGEGIEMFGEDPKEWPEL